MRVKAAILAGLVLGMSGQRVAAEVDVDAAIEYRQGVYRAMEWNLSELAAQVQGRRDYDAADFERRAGRIAFLSGILLEGFADEHSARGNEVDTRASYRIWQQKARFEEMMGEMQARSRALHEAARQADAVDQLRPQLGRLAQSCKACHDKYRD